MTASGAAYVTLLLAFRSLMAHRARTVLSALAVALSVAMTVALQGINRAILALFSTADLQAIGAGLFGQLKTMLGVVRVGVTAAAGFLVLNAFLMAVTQRRQELGALRALGMTRAQTLRLMLTEALLIGGAGTATGLLTGPPLAGGLLALLKALGGPLFNASLGLSFTLSGLLLAASLGLGVTLAVMLLPAWQAARVPPLEALRDDDAAIPHLNGPQTRRRRDPQTLGGWLLLAVLAAWLILARPGAWVTPPWDMILVALGALIWVGGLGLLLPAFIGLAARLARRLLAGRGGAVGRLVADNLARARLRVTLTVTTLAVGLTLIAGLSGFITFTFGELFGPAIKRTLALDNLVVAPFNPLEGMAAYTGLTSLELPPPAQAAIRQAVAGKAYVTGWHFTIVPQLAFLPNYFSFVLTPEDIAAHRTWLFTFTEGTWETARPWLEQGCALLIAPLIAQQNGVGLGDSLTVQGAAGPATCVVAGIGQPYVNASLIITRDRTPFRLGEPFALILAPAPDVAGTALLEAVRAATTAYPHLYVLHVDQLNAEIVETMTTLDNAFNALLLLTLVAAALGVVNTTLMSVTERQRELTLLRSIGATRRQVQTLVVGELALIGLLGGALGVLTGAGLIVILAVTYGGRAWGLPNLDLWGAAWRSVQPTLLNGLVGLFTAPVICAGAAALVLKSQRSKVRHG